MASVGLHRLHVRPVRYTPQIDIDRRGPKAAQTFYSLASTDKQRTAVCSSGGNINVAGGVIFSGDYTVTGGTGRFSGATGGGVFAGSALFLDETDGIGCFAVVGTISN